MLNGRYGADKLGFILLFASILLTFIAALLSPQNIVMRIILLFISAVILAFSVFRVFSRDVKMRKRELRAFEAALASIASLFKKKPDTDEREGEDGQAGDPSGKGSNIPDIGTDGSNGEEKVTGSADSEKVYDGSDGFKHFKCPRCKKHLKVPAGKGYIKVVCPVCGHRFTKHT